MPSTLRAKTSLGIPFNLTVAAENSDGSVNTGYNGTVHFTSTDAAAKLPADATLTAGVATFSVTLNTGGSQSITATDSSNSAEVGNTGAISVNQLQVTGLTPTSTGFSATFSEPFDPSQINLYDTLGTLGADDVTLVGPAPSTALVRGSLLIDPTDTTITFVKTSDFNGSNFNPATGVLAPGTYSVTLRSASNGFADLSGGLLNSNGTTGSNFTDTFVVAPTPVVVGVPAFARGPANTVNLPAATGDGIPFNLSSGAGVTSGVFTLQYNSALLDVIDATTNPALAGSIFSLDPSSTPGNAVLDFTSPTPLGVGVAQLGSLEAIIPNSAAAIYKTKALLHIASAQLNGGAIAVVGDDAVQVDAYDGDANGDGTLSGGDAFLISRVGVALDTNSAAGTVGGFAAFPNLDPVIIGDLTGSGNLNGADVTLLNCLLVGLARPQLPPLPTGLTIVPTGPDPTLSLPVRLLAAPNGTVTVPVDIDDARPAGSTGMTEATLALRFNPALFSVSVNDVQLGSLPSASGGWQLTTMINAQTGEIGIDLFGNEPIGSTAAGSLVTVTLHPRGTPPAGSTVLSLLAQANPTGQRTFQTMVGDEQGAFVLHTAASSGLWVVGGPVVEDGAWPVQAGSAVGAASVAWRSVDASGKGTQDAGSSTRAMDESLFIDQAFAALELTDVQPTDWMLQPAYRNDNNPPATAQAEDWLATLAQMMANAAGAASADRKGAVLLEPDQAVTWLVQKPSVAMGWTNEFVKFSVRKGVRHCSVENAHWRCSLRLARAFAKGSRINNLNNDMRTSTQA